MDLLFKRYASPFILLDEMISQCRLYEFVCEFMKIYNDEVENDTMWEYYLHRIFDKSFSEFLSDCKANMQAQAEVESFDFKTTIQSSFDVLNDFDMKE